MTKVNPHDLGLSKIRFWSSGEQLPVERIIARVLADPTEHDMNILEQHFGIDLMLSVWIQLKERKEVAESVIPITTNFLHKLT